MELNAIFSRLWKDYARQNPSADKVSELLKNEGETVINDHIAFRTLNSSEIDLNILASPFMKEGYVAAGEYFFKDKHLFAKHFEIPENKNAPRIFISHLILEECSPFIREVFRESFTNVDMAKLKSDEMLFAGSIFCPISYKTYEDLRKESEYAAWFYVYGFRANHFTVSVNALKKYNTILKVNELLKKNGFNLNSAGGEVKGTPADLLQQSSTMADLVKVEFVDGIYEVPSCYYEFAQRYPDSRGELYSGFIEKSADKIFESTNPYKKKI